MAEEVVTMVKIPFSQIEQFVRAKHSLPESLIDVRVESDSLILYFSDKPKTETIDNLVASPNIVQKKRRRRAHKKRHRMRTRGWEIVDRIVNSKGQKCVIYKPFIDALEHTMSLSDQRSVVAKILKSNRNKPTETSIAYFLENTLEYLKTKNKEQRARIQA